jgi:hypothetical protein
MKSEFNVNSQKKIRPKPKNNHPKKGDLPKRLITLIEMGTSLDGSTGLGRSLNGI